MVQPLPELMRLSTADGLALSVETPARYALRQLGALRRWGRLSDANRRIDELVLPLIAERRSHPLPAERASILSLLVGARTDDGEALSDNEIRDDLITLMLAGHETTATTLSWLIDLLLHHPPALAPYQAHGRRDGGVGRCARR